MRTTDFNSSSKTAARANPNSGDSNRASPTSLALLQSTPEVPLRATQQGIGNANADDRADQGMRARRRQAERPGTEIPDYGGDQQREDHGKSGAAADLQYEFDRKERNDAEGDGAAGCKNPEQIETARPDHCKVCRQRTRIDDGRDRVGGVVKAVDELKAEGDQKRDKQQKEGRIAGNFTAGRIDIGIDAVGDEQNNSRDDAAEDYAGQRIDGAGEVGALAGCRFDRTG